MRAAIIGCGNIAGGYDAQRRSREVWTHAKAFSRVDGVKLVAACDVHSGRRRSFCRRWRIAKAFRHVDKMMQAVRPEIVSICSPTEYHYEHVRTVLKYSPKAIICEKPIAYSMDEGKRIVDACQRSSVPLAVNYFRRWDVRCRELSALFKAGRFGKVQLARVLYSKGLFHNASHLINLLLSWFGPVQDVKIFDAHAIGRDDLLATFRLSMQRCPEVVFQSCKASWYEALEIDVLCEAGRIQMSRGGREVVRYDLVSHPVLPGSKILSNKHRQTQGTVGFAMLELLRNVVRVIQGHEKLRMPPQDALETVYVCELVRRAAFTKRQTVKGVR